MRTREDQRIGRWDDALVKLRSTLQLFEQIHNEELDSVLWSKEDRLAAQRRIEELEHTVAILRAKLEVTVLALRSELRATKEDLCAGSMSQESNGEASAETR